MSKRETAMEALIEATIALLVDSAPAEIPIKQIASKAGVNHGLVHHYFGSKEELINRAIRRSAQRLYERQPAELRSGYTFRFFREHRELLRILTRVVVDGPPELLENLTPPAERLDGWISQLDEQLGRLPVELGVDATVLNAFGIAAMMGWFTYLPLLQQAFRVPRDADETIQALLDRLDRLFERSVDTGEHDR